MANGEFSRKATQPWNVHVQQPWASEQIEAQHTEALWTYGENCLYTLMWRAQDFDAGLVLHCSECYGRSGAAFRQPSDKKCPVCFGTTFEGGFRAQVVRPTLFADRNVERTDTHRGTVDIDSPSLETTADFFCTKGDYVFRADASRYQVEQKGEAMVHTGYGYPERSDSFRGTIPAAHLEDPTSVAYIIPPTDPEEIQNLLGGSPMAIDVVGDPGLPVSPEMLVFTFTNEVAWVVPHNLNVLVPGTFVVTDPDDVTMLGRPDYATLTSAVVRWLTPTSGKVYVKR